METITPCIYFLIRRKKIVYIGQTRNFDTRARQHQDKIWDKSRTISCAHEKLNHYEERLIKLFKPEYNKRHLAEMYHKTIEIHPIYNKPELARRYYKEKTGEELENELARKRFWADKKINEKILLKVLRQALKEQIQQL